MAPVTTRLTCLVGERAMEGQTVEVEVEEDAAAADGDEDEASSLPGLIGIAAAADGDTAISWAAAAQNASSSSVAAAAVALAAAGSLEPLGGLRLFGGCICTEPFLQFAKERRRGEEYVH